MVAMATGSGDGAGGLGPYLLELVARAREGVREQPLAAEFWRAVESCAVTLLRAPDPAAEARWRLVALLGRDGALRAALRRLLRAPWPEPLPGAEAGPVVQLDLFTAPPPDPGGRGDGPPEPAQGSLGHLLRVQAEEAEVLEALVRMTEGSWRDPAERRMMAPWLAPVAATVLAQARILAEACRRAPPQADGRG
jgi:hypothetical protein